eukprot:TRINITY_DN3415_c0_g1_i1.p1 TRINITY_DN3415_c0_g1~~TRINITY_DN3415_c0_g1_i1.p1  ORF type:complete len:367 (-),score=106.74 TRINITY_DN3415_c0_g1_i1:1094-2194(-)
MSTQISLPKYPSAPHTKQAKLPQELMKFKVIVDNGKPTKEVFRVRAKSKRGHTDSGWLKGRKEEAKSGANRASEKLMKTVGGELLKTLQRQRSETKIIRRYKSKPGIRFKETITKASSKLTYLQKSSRLIIRNPDAVPEKPVFALSPVRWINESAYLIEAEKKGEKYRQRLELLMKPYAHRVLFQSSVYANRSPTVFFQYPPSARKQRLEVRVRGYRQDELGDCYLGFRVSDNTYAYKCVCKALKYAGFRIAKEGNWNVLWSGPSRNEVVAPMHSLQKINHFPGIMQIGRKDNLCRNINRLKRLHGKEYFICPSTYILPEDLPRFQREKDTVENQIWIMKPQASSCGRGIWLLGPHSSLLSKEYVR